MFEDLSEKLITHHVGGAWRAPFGTGMRGVRLPDGTSPGQIVLAGPQDVARAVRSAQQGQAALATMSSGARLSLLHRMADRLEDAAPLLAAAVVRAQGGCHEAAARDVAGLARAFRIRAVPEDPDGGQLALLTAMACPLTRTGAALATALAGGRAVVFKPAPGGAIIATLVLDTLVSVDPPPGALNLLQGDGPGSGALLAAQEAFGQVALAGGDEAAVALREVAGKRLWRI